MVRIMPSIDQGNRNPRAFSSLSLNSGILPRSFSYQKLPQQLLKLSVVKLDGSSFDVHISRNATVAELKVAVEGLFTSSPREGQEKISWSHVWGHFCLCHEGQKLVNDKANIRNLGIKDGDQLQFIRHMSINYKIAKQRSKNQSVASRQFSMSQGSNADEVGEQTTVNDNHDNEYQEKISRHHDCEEEQDVVVPEFKLAHFLKGWLSYSKLRGSTRKGYEGRTPPSRFSLHCYGGRSGMTRL